MNFLIYALRCLNQWQSLSSYNNNFSQKDSGNQRHRTIDAPQDLFHQIGNLFEQGIDDKFWSC